MSNGGLCACSVVFIYFQCNCVPVQLFMMIFLGIDVVLNSVYGLSV
jgi:hypothetical protein